MAPSANSSAMEARARSNAAAAAPRVQHHTPAAFVPAVRQADAASASQLDATLSQNSSWSTSTASAPVIPLAQMTPQPFMLTTTALDTPNATTLAASAVNKAASLSGTASPALTPAKPVGGGRLKRTSTKQRKEDIPPLCWTTELVEKLFLLRYKGLAKQFKNTRNKHDVHRGWIALSKELGKQRRVGVTSKQCQDKMKAMKQQWAEYKKDLIRTGNGTDRPRVNPKTPDTMLMYWGKSLGMNAETLFDDAGGRHQSAISDEINSEASESGEEDGEVKGANGGQNNKKQKLTAAAAISEGLGSLSKRMSHIGDSLAARNTVATDVAKLTEAIEKQTQSIQTLVQLLTQQQTNR